MKTTFRVLVEAKSYWKHLTIGFITLVISTLAGFYAPWALRELTNLATNGQADFASKSLNIGLLLLLATALQAGGAAISGYLNHYAALRYVADWRTKVYAKLQHMGLKFFNDSRTGDLTSRVVNDSIEAEILLAHVIPDLTVNILTFVGVGFLLFQINVKLALLSLITMPFLMAITIWQSKYLSPIWQENAKARGDLSSHVQDNFSGIREIQVFNQQKREEKKISSLARRHTDIYLKATLLSQATYPLLAFFTALGSVAVIIYGGLLIEKSQASIADIVAFIMYLSMFYGPIKSLSGIIEIAGNALSGCQRVFEVMDECSDVQDSPGARTLSQVNGKIEFKALSFNYRSETPVLKDINLQIKPGQTVAFVGATGVGKTTIVNLLNRFYDPQSGRVLVDDINIKDVTLKSLRDNISMVLQDTFLFNGSVYENIVYGWEDASKDQVIQATISANAHDFIQSLEDGYDTLIGERGIRLSGGQKQRLSIARAILRNAPILILDEATSALDTKTEKEIQLALDEISKGRTTLVIAHRLSTVQNADKIVVLDGTGIAEIGTHHELIGRRGIYASLYNTQAS